MVWLQKWRFEKQDIKTTSSKSRKIGNFFYYYFIENRQGKYVLIFS